MTPSPFHSEITRKCAYLEVIMVNEGIIVQLTFPSALRNVEQRSIILSGAPVWIVYQIRDGNLEKCAEKSKFW